jgi:hypothetical protein
MVEISEIRDNKTKDSLHPQELELAKEFQTVLGHIITLI